MTRRPRAAERLAAESGFSIPEVLVATGIMLVVLAGIFSAINPAGGTFQAQPEVSDIQQRLRVSIDAVQKDLVMAGAGTYAGASAGSLLNFFAPIMPFRQGEVNADDSTKFYSDRITIMYVPETPSQTTIASPMPPTSNELKVDQQPQCPQHDSLCGFSEGMRLIIFDDSGSWNTFTVTNVQDQGGNATPHLQRHGPDFNKSYGDTGPAYVTQVHTATYWWKRDTNQLMYYDGAVTDTPVTDNVINVNFEYFLDPQPPMMRRPRAECGGVPPLPCTTYGPAPPPLTEPGAPGYPVGENCVFRVDNNQHVPRLTDLTPGNPALILVNEGNKAMLEDGPWCPGPGIPGAVDADLFRIRQVRVTFRVQANLAMLRGTGALFTNAGSSSNAYTRVPDQELRFDIAPRNMNLGR